MKTLLFVISDLHLGGDKDYQICGAAGQHLLAGFLEWVAKQATKEDVHLIVNGDSVDFLAEREFSAFTADESAATDKLKHIFAETPAVWSGFASVVKAGAKVTFMLGNHDPELSLPGPRRELLELLGPGRVEFTYDNQALAIGDVLIEHGNQYDRWNKIDHNGLREVRAQLSRGREAGHFTPPPGSRLVHEIMNPLKEEFHFINLLKPENQSAIPILGILQPGVIRRMGKFAPLLAETFTVDTGAVAGQVEDAPSRLDPADKAALDLAQELTADGETGAVAGELFQTLKDKWREWTTGEKRKRQIQTVAAALRHWLGENLSTFDTALESREYLDAAERSAREGFRVVTYGHTHLAKRISLLGGTAVYLNSGTWADLMAVPDTLLLADDGPNLGELESFIDSLIENKIERWVSRIPSYVRVEMRDGKSVDADVWIYRGENDALRLPDGRLSRLMEKSAGAAGR